MNKNPRSLGVHDGVFHADEVTASALLIIFNLVDIDKIVRSRDSKILEKCEFVCDVGGLYDPKRKLFDHHQVDYKGDLSSAGMILLYLKTEGIISPELYLYFNNGLIKGVDDHDNGRSLTELGVCTFSHVIANFTPISQEVTKAEMDEHFFAALDFICGHLKRLKERFYYNINCRNLVKVAMDESLAHHRECLFFDRSIPWQESFFALDGKNHPALFVVMPAGAHWKLRAIPPDPLHKMDVRLPLPASWAGLLEDDLKRVTHIPGAIFCHKGRFTSVWEKREDALAALKKVLDMEGIKFENSF